MPAEPGDDRLRRHRGDARGGYLQRQWEALELGAQLGDGAGLRLGGREAGEAATARSRKKRIKEGEILVCRMTNPAWVVLFTKIAGLVTEAGGTVSHPAVVAREFGIPAVVGTTQRRRADQDRRPDPGQRHDRAWSRSSRERSRSGSRPASLDEALALRAERGDEATVVAGGTFLGILMNQGFLEPDGAAVARRRRRSCARIDVVDGELRLGAMATHRAVERDAGGARRLAGARARVRRSSRARGCATRRRSAACWPTPTTPRTRRRCSRALGARAVLRSPRGEREVRDRRADPRLLRDVHRSRTSCWSRCACRRSPSAAVYRKFRSRSTEDRPCVAVAAVRDGDALRVVVGAVAETPQEFPDVCARGERGRELARDRRRYAERIEPLSRRARLGRVPAARDRASRCGARSGAR